MAPILTGYITLRDEKHVAHTFGPGDEVPSWARSRITNPGAWVDPDEDDGQAPPAPPIVPPAAVVPSSPPAPSGDPDGDENHEPPAAVVAGDEPPPMGGKGSGAPAWRAYAAAHHVEVDEDASRDEVIEALRAADVRVE